MNRNVKKIFSEAHNAMSRYDASIQSAFSTYKLGKERARKESERYKNESEEYEARRKALADTAATAIETADREFCDTINLDVIPKLREAISDHVTQRPSTYFLEALKIYSDYNIPMSRMELSGLMTACGGCFLGLRALSSVAEQSGYRLSFDGVDTYERDITRLEKLARFPMAYAPLNYVNELKEVVPKRPIFRDNGTVAYSIDTETVYAITRAQELSSLWHDLEDIGDRWASALVPSIETLAPIKDENTGETITPAEQHITNVEEAIAQVGINTKDAEQLAAVIGAEKAAAAKQSADILSHYTT